MGSKLVLLGTRECNVFENKELRRTFAPERERESKRERERDRERE
jgi:hypothetical protein